MSDPRIRADSVGHWHRPNAWLFRSLDLTIPAGTALAILGPNGRGKSTLLRILAGLVRPREGGVRITGRAAFVPAGVSASFDYTAREMVLMGRARQVGLFVQPTLADENAAEAALARLEIGHLSARAFATLSSGERQMVLLARALASEADVLFMDEPTAALDLRHQLWVAVWMRRLVRDNGMSLVFATHDPNLARDIAAEVLLMHTAPKHEVGPTGQLLSPSHLSRLFDCEIVSAKYDYNGQPHPFFAALPRGV